MSCRLRVRNVNTEIPSRQEAAGGPLHHRTGHYYPSRHISLRCARFPEILQNFSERQILWSLCSVVFLAFALKLPIQTSLSVAPKLPVCLHSGEKCEKFRKTSTSLPQVKGVPIGLFKKTQNWQY